MSEGGRPSDAKDGARADQPELDSATESGIGDAAPANPETSPPSATYSSDEAVDDAPPRELGDERRDGNDGHDGMELPDAEISDAAPRRFGMLVIAVVFGGFGLWSLLAPLDSAALAPGVVTVKDYRKTVQHLEGGIVREILVRDGAKVEAGEPLLVLDNTQFVAELGVVTGQYFTALALDSRLASERDGLETLRFADELLTADDPRATEAMSNQRELFRARREDRLGEITVLEQRVAQLDTQIDGLEALISAKREIIASLTEEIDDLDALLREGFANKQRLRELQRNRSASLGEIADHEAAIASARVRIGETELEILQLNKRFITDVVDQLADAQAQVYDLGQRRSALRDKVQRTVLRAPVAGIVLGMNTHTIGGVIQSGKTLLEIVPASPTLVIDARLSPMDIDRVKVGATADIRFSAFKNTYTIFGELVRVSADRLVDEQSGESYYSARIEIPEEEVARLGDLTLLPGMPAEVFVNTGERTLFQYLVTPASNMFARSMIED